jgi:hypothetical protein
VRRRGASPHASARRNLFASMSAVSLA